MHSVDVVKQYYSALEQKDIPAMSELMHEDYHFTGPMMEIRGREQMAQMMKDFPFVAEDENVELSGDGDVVVRRLDWHVRQPFDAVIPLCEWLVVEGGKIRSATLYYDTAKFPAGVLEQMQAG